MADDEEKAHDVLAAEEFAMPAPDVRLAAQNAHDVLAAEEFGMGSADPDLARRAPRDVLAAEEFAVPAPDPGLTISGLPLPLPLAPDDPGDRRPPQDVLAAEGFAVPGSAPRALGPDEVAPAPAAERRRPGMALVGLLALGAWRIRRQRRARREPPAL